MIFTLPFDDDTPRRIPPLTTYTLVGLCCLIYLWQAGLPQQLAEMQSYRFGMIPAVLFGTEQLPPRLHAARPAVTLVTSMFVHGGLMHIAGNMLYLWLFGRAVENALGTLRFMAFYLCCGIVAALFQAFSDPGSTVPMVGASGAIAGALGAYLMFYPRASVRVFIWFIIIFRIVFLPAVLLLGLWFLLQLYGAVSAGNGAPGVAVWAHVGGFVTGLILAPVFRPAGSAFFQPRRSPRFAVTRPTARHSVPVVIPNPRDRWDRGPWG